MNKSLWARAIVIVQVGLMASLFNAWNNAGLMIARADVTPGPLTIVAYGDSLTAGYMLPPSAAFPAVLAKELKSRGHDVDVINAGVSGDTTAAGLERFEWAVPEAADAVILELGANDALRGLEPGQVRANLEAIITKLRTRGIEVLLAGMVAPKSLGSSYTSAFDPIYADLAAKHDLILYPFFLEGVATISDLNLSDGMHPNPKGVGKIVSNILPKVEELIARTRQKQSQSRL